MDFHQSNIRKVWSGLLTTHVLILFFAAASIIPISFVHCIVSHYDFQRAPVSKCNVSKPLLSKFYAYMLHTMSSIKSWFNYLQIWLVGINATDKVQLCLKILGHMPGSVHAHCQGVRYLSIWPPEGGWEVSAMIQNDNLSKFKQETRYTTFKKGELKCVLEKPACKHMLENNHDGDNQCTSIHL